MQLGGALGLDSACLASLSQPGWTPGSTATGTAVPRRSDLCSIESEVRAVLFDFDGTLTATPGDRAERRYKIAELTERAPMLEPWLIRLREAGMMLGIVSKSSESTILAALDAAGLRKHFDGPILAKAVGLERKAGFIQDLCSEGELSHLGSSGLSSVLLIDDDIAELAGAMERGIQTYPAPEDGGLQEDNFFEILTELGLPTPERPVETHAIHRLWTAGITGECLGHYNTGKTQVEYCQGGAPLLSDYYDVVHEDLLGKGSFGTCRPAVHKETGRRAAMKIMRLDVVGKQYKKHFIDDDYFDFQLMMTRENYHPNVIGQLDYFVGPKLIYNAQDLLEGQDLGLYLKHHAPITELLAKRCMYQVLSALAHIHYVRDVGLIHRDVKLENLRFRKPDPRSDLVLLDFGLSCSKSEERKSIVGTQLYMAPEVFSHYYNEKVDMWSFGVVLYILLTGGSPWQRQQRTSSNVVSLDPKIASGEAVACALDAAQVQNAPPDAVELLRTVLVLEPDERPAAAVAIEHAWCSGGKDGGDAIQMEVGPFLSVRRVSYTETSELSLLSPKLRRPRPTKWELEVDMDCVNGTTDAPTPTGSSLGTPSVSKTTPTRHRASPAGRLTPQWQMAPPIPEAVSGSMEVDSSPIPIDRPPADDEARPVFNQGAVDEVAVDPEAAAAPRRTACNENGAAKGRAACWGFLKCLHTQPPPCFEPLPPPCMQPQPPP